MFNLPWAKNSKIISDKRYNKMVQKTRQAFKKWIKKEIKSKIKSAENNGDKYTSIHYSYPIYFNYKLLDIVNNIESELIKHGYKVEHDSFNHDLKINWEE